MAIAGLGVGTYMAFVRAGLFIDPTFPGAGSALALFGATGWVAARERSARRFVRGAFGRYASADLVDALVRDPDRLVLGGETREMTVLFSDIRGFTTLAEGMEATELTAYLNAYLTAMTDVVAANGGTIDKFIGDAVMAFWNAPLDTPDHAARACAAALGMQAALAAFNRAHAGRWPPTAIGIGINTGVCVVGNLGSRQRFDYSAIGDEVNVAARLETLTKDLGEPILVGAATAAAAAGFVFEPAGRVAVKGRREPVEVLALRGRTG
jgi:adenylate cyclase